LYFKNTVPRVSLLFTLSATVNTVYAMILRACKCIKSETRELTIFSLKIVSSIARGSSPYQARWLHRGVRRSTTCRSVLQLCTLRIVSARIPTTRVVGIHTRVPGCDTRVLNLVRRGDPTAVSGTILYLVLYPWAQQSIVHCDSF
jgi:hypothetical protein